jgi:hypothetical protein
MGRLSMLERRKWHGVHRTCAGVRDTCTFVDEKRVVMVIPLLFERKQWWFVASSVIQLWRTAMGRPVLSRQQPFLASPST